MSDAFIAFIFAAGVSGWTYSKMSRRLGYGNTQNLVVFLAVTFLLVFAAFYVLLKYIVHL